MNEELPLLFPIITLSSRERGCWFFVIFETPVLGSIDHSLKSQRAPNLDWTGNWDCSSEVLAALEVETFRFKLVHIFCNTPFLL